MENSTLTAIEVLKDQTIKGLIHWRRENDYTFSGVPKDNNCNLGVYFTANIRPLDPNTDHSLACTLPKYVTDDYFNLSIHVNGMTIEDTKPNGHFFTRFGNLCQATSDELKPFEELLEAILASKPTDYLDPTDDQILVRALSILDDNV